MAKFAWGLQPTADGSFHERRRIRDEWPVVFMMFCMTAITGSFVAFLGQQDWPHILLGSAFLGWFWWFLAVRSTDIRIQGGTLIVRRGLLRRKVSLGEVRSVFAEGAGLVKARVFLGIGTLSATYTAARIRVRLQRGPSIYLKTVEPKHLLGALDQALPPSVPRLGKAWAQFGVRGFPASAAAESSNPDGPRA